MTETTSKPNRPSSVTLISVLAIYSGILGFYFVFSLGNQNLGGKLFYIFGAIVFLACGMGFWLMKKWAIYTYAVFAIIDQIALILMGRWNILALLIPVIVLYIGYKHFSKMS
ncbi:MAG TPA: hypothetical protein VK249_00685 [Anaerolineales bacterium]|nr:hypothetical protein [Anaerolineales bacterium]